MDRLPPEIAQKIFFYIDDFNTLRAVVSTCRYLRAAFTSHEKLIATQVLLNQIDWDVLPEAVVVNESSRLGEYDPHKAKEFSERHLKHRMTSLNESTRRGLAEAMSIVRLHEIVKFLAKQIANECLDYFYRPGLRACPGLERRPREPKPSPKDLYRIQRALYRFQLYWNMFGLPASTVPIDQQQDVFFQRFNFWENEQLACVQCSLHKAILIRESQFNSIAYNSRGVRINVLIAFYECIDFEALGIELCVLDILIPWGDDAAHLLSQGLDFFYQIVTATSSANACRLANDKIFPRDLRRQVANNIDKGLRMIRGPYMRQETLFKDVSWEDKKSLMENPYCNDDNSSAMLKLLEKTCDGCFITSYENITKGYAFWDWHN